MSRPDGSALIACLPLRAGVFKVLLDPGEHQTCYTNNSTGTSSTGYAARDALLAFADQIIANLRPKVEIPA